MGTDDDVTTVGTGFDTKRFTLAEHRLNTGHPTDALATLAEADPEDVRTWALRAAAFSALGDHVRAQHTAEEGLRLDPHDLPLLRLLADAQLELGLRIKTEDTLRAAMASHPDADVLLVDLADLRIDEGRYDLARDLLERAVAAGALNPSGRLAREVLMAYNEVAPSARWSSPRSCAPTNRTARARTRCSACSRHGAARRCARPATS